MHTYINKWINNNNNDNNKIIIIGGSDYTAATTYFGRKFIKLNRDPDKQIYTHLTWATDTNQVKVVMAAVADIIRRFNLRTAGLMWFL